MVCRGPWQTEKTPEHGIDSCDVASAYSQRLSRQVCRRVGCRPGLKALEHFPGGERSPRGSRESELACRGPWQVNKDAGAWH